jgi:DNA-binding SARP family transcriptional activator/tetratricopeptide (TPR) repeat protein
MEIQLLGDLQIWHEGRQVELGGQRQQCVLAVLLLNPGQVVATEKIIARAWPAEPPVTATNLVTSYISRLRRTLASAGGIALKSRPPGFLAAVDLDQIDAHRFLELIRLARIDRESSEPELAATQLRRALTLWRGTPLADLDSPWLRDRGVAMEAIRLDAVEELAEITMEAGHFRDAIALLREPHTEHPERERLAALLIRSLHSASEPAQAAQAAERAVRGVRALGLEPGPLLRQAHQESLSSRAVLHPSLRLGPRRQLPSSTPAFTGRIDELDLLSRMAENVFESADPSGAGVFAIDGMGGIGKTALVLRAAHAVADRFPDGQLFLDLRGHTPGSESLTTGDALEWFLRSLGTPPQLIPQDPDQRGAVYRDRLRNTRTLIILDNACSAEQVKPLLPGAGRCLVLITSRQHLAGLDDAHTLNLDVLPERDAIALFRFIAGPARVQANDPALAEAVALCGHLPLAVRIAAARVRSRRALTVGVLAAQLRDEHQRLSGLSVGERNVSAAFDLSHAHLPVRQQHMFRCLGLAPGPDFDAFAAASLADTDYHTAGHLLESLLEHNLLIQRASGRYCFHDLVRIHARALSDHETAANRDAALHRLFDYYQYTAGQADMLVARHSRCAFVGSAPAHFPVLANPDQARTWLRIECANLMACAGKAIDNAWADHTVALVDGLATVLRTDGPWPQARALHAAAATAAEHLGDSRGRAHALFHLGMLQRLSGDMAGATRSLEQARSLSRNVGDQQGLANAITELGSAQLDAGDYSRAAENFQESLELYRGLGDKLGQAHALIQSGAVRRQSGDVPDAVRHLEEAVELCRGAGYQLSRANALTHLGQVRLLTGDYADASRCFEEAFDLCRDLGDRRGEAHAVAYSGVVRKLRGDHTAAARQLESALEVYRGLGDRRSQAVALVELGSVRGAAGDLAGAMRDLEQARDLFHQMGARADDAWLLNRYAAVVVATGDFERALALYREALHLATDVRTLRDQGFALEGIGECSLHARVDPVGVSYLNRALEIFRRLGMRPDVERVESRLLDLDEP